MSCFRETWAPDTLSPTKCEQHVKQSLCPQLKIATCLGCWRADSVTWRGILLRKGAFNDDADHADCLSQNSENIKAHDACQLQHSNPPALVDVIEADGTRKLSRDRR